MEYKFKFYLLICAANLTLSLAGCQKSTEETPAPEPTVQTLTINCENRDANLIPGLTPAMGQAPSNPTNVAAGIQKHKELISSDPKNAEFYSRQIDLMSQKLTEFNTRFASSCGQ